MKDIVYFNCKLDSSWWSWYYSKTKHTNSTHHKNNTPPYKNIGHTTTQIQDTTRTGKTIKIQSININISEIYN